MAVLNPSPQRAGLVFLPLPNQDIIARDQAVVDIGSNSVRLVVYKVEGRANAPMLNEKVQAALGKGIPETGRLNAEGKDLALKALKRFSILLDSMGVTNVKAVATAAMRFASDGPAFLDEIRQMAGFDVQLISGEEEARLSALGVLAGNLDAQGVVGDLGGSSLELVKVGGRHVHAQESWGLGPLAYPGSLKSFDLATAKDFIDKNLKKSGVLSGADKGGDFHAVGGAWRSLAKVHMALHNYPLAVLHNYEMDRASVLALCSLVKTQSQRSLERMKLGLGKRADSLPFAAQLLERIVEMGNMDRVIISAHGVREGILYEGLTPHERLQDPLVAGAVAMMHPDQRGFGFAHALFDWVNPLFSDLPQLFPNGRGAIMRQSACMLADIGALLHPDHRTEMAADLVLRAPYPAASHAERVFLAIAIGRRYGPDSTMHRSPLAQRILDPERIKRAVVLGAALRLGADLSGRSAHVLQHSSLRLSDWAVQLRVDPTMNGLMSDYAMRRLHQLAAELKLEPQVILDAPNV